MLKKLILLFFLTITLGTNTHAKEETLDLEAEVAPKPAPAPAGRSVGAPFSLMGRIDLSTETTAPQQDAEHQLKNNHFLVFLKVKASAKTSFMGQIITTSPTFFYADYLASEVLNIQFGKIMVPFGDNRRFHHLYGGVQDLAGRGVMLPNIWAETGLNLEWKKGSTTLDTYIVNSAKDSVLGDDDVEVGSSGDDGRRQAVGVRSTFPLLQNSTAILSGYHGSYAPGRGLSLNLIGADFYSDYGFFDVAALRQVRFALGIAMGFFENHPDHQTDLKQSGDYIELATKAMAPGEARFRYGTFIDRDNKKTDKDSHSFALGYSMPVDVIRLLVEYQWNFESVNERDNDLLRGMASVDF